MYVSTRTPKDTYQLQPLIAGKLFLGHFVRFFHTKKVAGCECLTSKRHVCVPMLPRMEEVRFLKY